MSPILNLLFPGAIATSLLSDANGAKTHKATVASTIHYEYMYDGNNIMKIKTTNGTSETTTIYQYDNKINPYYKSFYYLQEKPLDFPKIILRYIMKKGQQDLTKSIAIHITRTICLLQ